MSNQPHKATAVWRHLPKRRTGIAFPVRLNVAVVPSLGLCDRHAPRSAARADRARIGRRRLSDLQPLHAARHGEQFAKPASEARAPSQSPGPKTHVFHASRSHGHREESISRHTPHGVIGPGRSGGTAGATPMQKTGASNPGPLCLPSIVGAAPSQGARNLFRLSSGFAFAARRPVKPCLARDHSPTRKVHFDHVAHQSVLKSRQAPWPASSVQSPCI